MRPVESRDLDGVMLLVSTLQPEGAVAEDVRRCMAAGRDPISEVGSSHTKYNDYIGNAWFLKCLLFL